MIGRTRIVGGNKDWKREPKVVVIDEVRAGLNGAEVVDEVEMDHNLNVQCSQLVQWVQFFGVCAAAAQAQVTNAFLSPPSKFSTRPANNTKIATTDYYYTTAL